LHRYNNPYGKFINLKSKIPKNKSKKAKIGISSTANRDYVNGLEPQNVHTIEHNKLDQKGNIEF
jgi:hypothetical protein